jgi:hypothetical protein
MTTVNKINYYQSGKIQIFGRGQVYKLDNLKTLNPWYFLIR